MIFDWKAFLIYLFLFLLSAGLFWLYSIGKLKIKRVRRKKGAMNVDPNVAFGFAMLIGLGGVAKAIAPLLREIQQLLFW